MAVLCIAPPQAYGMAPTIGAILPSLKVTVRKSLVITRTSLLQVPMMMTVTPQTLLYSSLRIEQRSS